MSAWSTTVVVCAYTLERWDDILEAVASARAQDPPPCEIIIIVDHNVELRDRLKAELPDLCIVDNQRERGLSGARNTGISLASGELIAFLDDDAVASPEWLALMTVHFERPQVVGVTSSSRPKWLGPRPSWFPEEYLWTLGCSYRGLPDTCEPVRSAHGGAMCCRSDIFRKVGGFNPSLGRNHCATLLSCEETELCVRVASLVKGATFIYEPRAFIDHKVPPKRVTWNYFLRRCYAEGVSKAYLAKLNPSRQTLAPERRYVSRILPLGFIRGFRDAMLRCDRGGIGRAAAIVAGLAAAVAGYAVGHARILTLAGQGVDYQGQIDIPPAVPVATSATCNESNAATSNLLARLRGVTDALGVNSLLLTNAGAIAFGSFATSTLGFIYWWVAARNFTPEAVGLAAAAISLMTLIGIIGELGLGTLLMGESLLSRPGAGGLIAASLSTAIVLSTVLGTCFLSLGPGLIGKLSSLDTSLDEALLFVAGCGIMSFAMVLDQALIGSLRGAQQMCRSVLFSALKLAMLAAAVVAYSVTQEVTILATWVFGQLAAIVLFAGWLVSRGQPVWHRPEVSLLRGRMGRVLRHHFLNSVTQAPGFLLPGLVTMALSAQIDAAFYAALTLINVACYLPAALATVLFTIGSSDPDSFPNRLRFSLSLSGVISLLAAIGFFLFSDLFLQFFNPAYSSIAGTSLKLMGFVVLPIVIKFHFIALQRLMNRMGSASVLLGIGGAFELGVAYAGAQWNGLSGLTLAWVLANYVQAALMLPGILKTFGNGREFEGCTVPTPRSIPS
jgi:GT2 family glycosyltransferase/O-antigen/teichoic acid export membrane protein